MEESCIPTFSHSLLPNPQLSLLNLQIKPHATFPLSLPPSILIVDDNVFNLLALETIIVKYSLQVDKAMNGEDAV